MAVMEVNQGIVRASGIPTSGFLMGPERRKRMGFPGSGRGRTRPIHRDVQEWSQALPVGAAPFHTENQHRAWGHLQPGGTSDGLSHKRRCLGQPPAALGTFSLSESESRLVDSFQPHGLYSLGQNTEVGSHSLLQGILPTRGSNPGLPHCRRILYQPSHKGSPK